MKLALLIARIYDILFSDLTTLRWSEAWMALIFGVTLACCNVSIQSKDALFFTYIIPLWLWSSVFTIYGIIKLVLVIDMRKWWVARIGLTLIGILMWSYVFAVSAVFTPFSVTDMLFLMPLLAESWVLATTLGVKIYVNRVTST